jgi:prepilin-type N-terminal cleavage/methylation domain-containing protein
VTTTVESKMGVFRRPSPQQGFTFNEILVAMAISGIAVLGYTATTITVIRGNRASENYTIAVNLAQDKMEQLKAHARLANGSHCPAAGETGIKATGATGGIFNRCWKIADSTLAANLKQIEVTVTWRDAEPRSVSLATLVYQE